MCGCDVANNWSIIASRVAKSRFRREGGGGERTKRPRRRRRRRRRGVIAV